mgnify:CR=1 FL=1
MNLQKLSKETLIKIIEELHANETVITEIETIIKEPHSVSKEDYGALVSFIQNKVMFRGGYQEAHLHSKYILSLLSVKQRIFTKE